MGKEAILDSTVSWRIAWLCCFINFLQLGISRIQGMLFLASITRYSANRRQASLPFVLCHAVRNVSGPFMGYLGKTMPVRPVLVSGCILSSIAVGACFFAENILTLTILWGVVFGFGFGMSTLLIPQVLHQYFDKYFANANGISFGGECIAGFVLPVIVEFLLDTYGISGTFLVLSSLMLHSVPAALLIKPSTKHEKSYVQPANMCDKYICDKTETFETHLNFTLESTVNTSPKKPNAISTTDVLHKVPCPAEKRKGFTHSTYTMGFDKMTESECLSTSIPSTFKFQDISTHIPETGKHTFASSFDKRAEYERHSASTPLSFKEKQRSTNTHETAKHDVAFENVSEIVGRDLTSPYTAVSHNKHCCDKYSSLDTCLPSTEINRNTTEIAQDKPKQIPSSFRVTHKHSSLDTCLPSTEINRNTTQIAQDKPKQIPSSFRVFLDPTFILIILTQSSLIFIGSAVVTTIVEFTRDAGIARNKEAYVLMCLSISDMIGRFGFGWVTDSGFMGSVPFASLTYSCLGILICASTFLQSFELLVTTVFFLGLFMGGLLVVFPSVVSNYIEKECIAMALASRYCLAAPMLLVQSSLIGYFRETRGSYNGLFYILAVNCGLCSLLCLLTPYAARWRERRKEKS